MRATINIDIFGNELPALVEFHYSLDDACITDVFKIEVEVDGAVCNLMPLYPAISKEVDEELTDKFLGEDYE